ncbi:MAG: YjjG family noncanonical pyrimidine nucleotidase [Ginsengibacter sp.]
MNKINSLSGEKSKYKHLFFDLDHTLWDFDANAKETLIEVHRVFNLAEKNVHPFEDFYKIYLNHNTVLWDRYHKGFITSEDLKWKRMWRTLVDFKIGDEVLAKDISAKFLDILPTKKLLFDYTVEILEYLAGKNYSLHLITNGFEKTQWNKINNANLSKYFTHVITSEKCNAIKPAKEIFEYAIKIAGANLEESIMIGDNPDADIQGAINAGMDNIFVNHTGIKIEITPTYTINALQELEDIL